MGHQAVLAQIAGLMITGWALGQTRRDLTEARIRGSIARTINKPVSCLREARRGAGPEQDGRF